MERNDVALKVKEKLAEIIDESIDAINEDANILDDLEISSIEVLTMLADLEADFNIVISESDLRHIISVSELIDVVWEKIK